MTITRLTFTDDHSNDKIKGSNNYINTEREFYVMPEKSNDEKVKYGNTASNANRKNISSKLIKSYIFFRSAFRCNK